MVTEGTDVTLVAYGPLVKTARDAALAAADEGVSIEVIDLRSLAPVDFATVEASVRKTGRLVITHEAGQSGGLGAEVAASITERCFYHLEAAPSGSPASTFRTRTRSWRCTTCPTWTGSSTASTAPWAARTPSAGWKDERHHDQGIQAARPRRGSDRVRNRQLEGRVGDTVALNQIIAEVETAKAVVELPSPFAGVVTALHEQPGTVVEVGKPIVSFEVEDDAGGVSGCRWPLPAEARHRRSGSPTSWGTAPSSKAPAARPAGPRTCGPGRSACRRPVRPSLSARPRSVEPAAKPDVHRRERPRSTPPVRKLAKDLGVDLAAVPGTGADGLITRDDVRNFVGGGDLPAAAQDLAGAQAAAGTRTARASGKPARRSRASASSPPPPWWPAPSPPRTSRSS